MNSLEDLHANRMMTVDLGLLEDPEIISVLSNDAADEYSIDEDGSIGVTLSTEIVITSYLFSKPSKR